MDPRSPYLTMPFGLFSSDHVRKNPIIEDFETSVNLLNMYPLKRCADLCEDISSPISSYSSCMRNIALPTSTPSLQRSKQQTTSPSDSSQSSQSSTCTLSEFRCHYPKRFLELCRVHLSFVIDIPADFLQDIIDDAESYRGSSCSFQTNSIKSGAIKALNSSPNTSSTTELNSQILTSIDRLIHLLESRLEAEGIFRKSGQVLRQRQLRELVSQEMFHEDTAEVALSDLRCGVHDIAGVLKASLGDLTEPLLTDRLQCYFLKVAELSAPRLDDNGQHEVQEPKNVVHTASKQLRGYQLLLLLLPVENCQLLHKLLALLKKVADIPKTLMTPENLGTVFGPLLLCPRQTHQTDLQRTIALSNEAVAYMIRHLDDIFKVPEHMTTAAQLWLTKIRNKSSSCLEDTPIQQLQLDDVEEDAVDLCVTFTTRHSEVDDSYTKVAVANLYATIQAMPPSSKKDALIKKFNNANGGLSAHQKGYKRCRKKVDSSNADRGCFLSDCSPFKRHKVAPRHNISVQQLSYCDVAVKPLSSCALPRIEEDINFRMNETPPICS